MNVPVFIREDVTRFDLCCPKCRRVLAISYLFPAFDLATYETCLKHLRECGGQWSGIDVVDKCATGQHYQLYEGAKCDGCGM